MFNVIGKSFIFLITSFFPAVLQLNPVIFRCLSVNVRVLKIIFCLLSLAINPNIDLFILDGATINFLSTRVYLFISWRY